MWQQFKKTMTTKFVLKVSINFKNKISIQAIILWPNYEPHNALVSTSWTGL